MTGAAFDSLAARYDALWSESPIGRAQREAVWRRIDPLFKSGDTVLDLGCGTGVDALHLAERGVRVRAIDASAGMVRIARDRGVDARKLRIEELPEVSGVFDGAISNFGAFNCVRGIPAAACELARLVRRGGHLAICVMGPCAIREFGHYLVRGKVRKACRRWRAGGTSTSLGVRVTYPTVRQLARAFAPDFLLIEWCGIGLAVPPSYVDHLSVRGVERLAAIDRRIAHWPALRALADHRLLIFTRV